MIRLNRLYLTCALAIAGTACVSGPVFAAETSEIKFSKIFDQTPVKVSPELAARVPKKIRDRGALVIGSDNSYPPWEFLAGKDGQTPEGIDVDLGKAIAKTLDLKFESRTADFAAILPALGVKYDLGISAFSVTAERLQAVNFVTYVRAKDLWVVRAGNPTKFDPANYCGRSVAVNTGSIYERQVAEDNDACKAAGKTPIKILPFGKTTEAITRVMTGGADASAPGGSFAVYAVLQSGGTLETVVPAGDRGKGGYNGIAIAKSDMELTRLIADTLNHLIKTGIYGQIYSLWGIDQFMVPEALVNPDPAGSK